jgi:protease IV
LVDEVGGLHDAIHFAAQKASLTEGYAVVDFPKLESEEEAIANALRFKSMMKAKKESAVMERLQTLYRDLNRQAGQYNDPMGAYLRCELTY